MNKQMPQNRVQKSEMSSITRVANSSGPQLYLTPMAQMFAIGGAGKTRPQDILHLQRTFGNQVVQRLLNNPPGTNPESVQESNPEVEEPEEELTEEPVELDMDEDEEPEPHTLSLNAETGQIMVHSDPETLEDLLKKYQKKFPAPQDQKALAEIKQAASIVHTGRYGTKYTNVKGYTKTKAPTVTQRSYVKPHLTFIAQKLQTLSKARYRPPSHKSILETEDIDGETFCKKIVMEPLSLLPRDDGVEGSYPYEETQLWRSLTNFAGYKRGHMLNEHLHGPGKNENLVPISTAFNAVMREGVEKVAKKAVNSENKVVRFEAVAQDWGQFPGAFGYPEEKKLPNKFYFKVQQMKKVGGNGSQIGDWATNGPILHQSNPVHDIPTDVVSGVTKPTLETFVPGLYSFPFGTIKQAGTNFHLKGNFSINSGFVSADVLAGLGIDDPANLKHKFLSETVLTEYQLPKGYGLKKVPVKEIEYISVGNIYKYPIPNRAFMVYNLADEKRLQQEYQKKLDIFKEEQNLLAQKKLDEEQKRKLEELRRKNEWQMRQEEDRRRKELEQQRAKENDQYRHKLLGQIRLEMAKHVQEYGELFEKKREETLYYANSHWKLNSNLIDVGMDELLAPVRNEIGIAVEKFKAAKEEKARFIEGLTDRFDKAIDEYYMPRLLTPKAQEVFRKDVAIIYQKHEEYWLGKELSYLQHHGPEKMWESPKQKLDHYYAEAIKYQQGQTLGGAELVVSKRFYNSVEKLDAGTSVELIPHPEGVSLGAYYYVKVLDGNKRDSQGEIRKTQVLLP